MWKDPDKTLLRGKRMALNAYNRKEGRSQISNLSFHLKKLEKEEQIKPKESRGKNRVHKLIKLKTESQQRKINKTQSCFF